MRFRTPVTLAAAALALWASALLWHGCRRPAERPSLVRIAHESDLLSLDPSAVREAVTQSVLNNIYEGLVSFDRDMRIAPALAVNWSAPDERTWTIELRRGVRFHDGRPVLADDVKYTLDRARSDPASGVRGLLATVEGVKVVGDHTIRLRTRRPEPLLVNNLAYVLILPAGSAERGFLRPVGTGPYRFVSWKPGVVLELEAFGDYWGGRPPIPRAHFVPVEQAEHGEQSVQALREGRVDVLRQVPERLAAEVRQLGDVRLVSRTGLLTYYLFFDCRSSGSARNPFADRRVRQAISLAIDRQAIIRGLQGYGVAADQIVQKGVFGYVAGEPGLRLDPQRARALLAEAGYPKGFGVRLVHRSQASVAAVSEMLREMLGQVGVRLELEPWEWPRIVDGWQNARLPFFLAGWRFENGDASSFLRDVVATRDPGGQGGSLNPGFSSPELDALIEENAVVFGEGNRLKQYARLMEMALREMPLVPLYHRLNLYGVSRRLRWEPRLDDKLLAAEMSWSEP